MRLEKGKIYNVASSRKGKFKMLLTFQDETWATGIITEGKAKAILSCNEVNENEKVTVRKSLTEFSLSK